MTVVPSCPEGCTNEGCHCCVCGETGVVLVDDGCGSMACGVCAEAERDRCDYEGGEGRAALDGRGRP